jgi:hypothetical protein
MDSLSLLKEKIFLKKPAIISNLMLFPVVSKTPSEKLEFNTLNEGMSKGTVSVSEARKSHRWVEVQNSHQDKDLFIIDGEGITGGKQNRIADLSIIINRNQSKTIPAFCSEKYRWSGADNFSISNTIAFPTIRKINTKSKSFPDKAKDAQSSIWGEIQRKSQTLKSFSPTQSMQSIYEDKQNELDKFKDYKPQENQIGFLAATQKRLLCLDIFYNTGLFLKFYEKLLMSYAIDGLEDLLYGKGSFHTQNLQAFFQAIFAATLIKQVKKYQEYRYKIKQGFGKALIRNKQLIHASFFQDNSVI